VSTEQRISKREFIAEVSHASGVPAKVVAEVYDAMIERLLANVRKGIPVTLTGFGKFYAQRHRGHRVQFADGGGKQIGDYSVLKFSATRAVNKSLGTLRGIVKAGESSV
jgi:DNA-binding protein HU-beta